MSVRRRLEALEEQAMPRRHVPEAKLPHSDARRHMRDHLERIAALRRGELDTEEVAKVESLNAAFKDRRTRIRGEGASYEHL